MTRPSFGAGAILLAIMEGKFHEMAGSDFQQFMDAPAGTLLCWDMDGWIVLVCPGEPPRIEAHLFPSVEASGNQDEAQCVLIPETWENL